MSKKEKLPKSYPCHECLSGIVQPRYVTYFTWLNDELITVPNFPAWICNICGKREYDYRALSWLTTLLTPNAGQKSVPEKKISPTHHSSERVSSVNIVQPKGKK